MVDTVICTAVMVLLLVVAFYAGFRVADYFAKRREEAVAYALKKQYARLMAGVDADSNAMPYVTPDQEIQ
jgi:hypothetical protein